MTKMMLTIMLGKRLCRRWKLVETKTDTMLAQLADGEFVSRADAVLEWNIMELIQKISKV